MECKRIAVATANKKKRDRGHASSQEEVVTCRICGVQRRRMTAHLKTEHGLTKEKYVSRFPGTSVEVSASRIRSAECREKMASAAQRRWATNGEREAQSERLKVAAPWKGKRRSEEDREAISRGGLGKPHDVSVEGRKVMGENGKRALLQLRARPGYPEICAENVRKRIAGGEEIGFMRKDVQAKSLASRIRNGTLVPPGAGRGICGWRQGLPHYCRSTLEANFARILIHEDIEYDYEPKLFRLPSGRHYLPDFFLYEAWRQIPAGWVEFRGWRNKDGSLAGDRGDKIQEFEATESTTVFVLAQTDDSWKQLHVEFSPKISLWERPRRNLKTHPEIFGVIKVA